ncbi:unnamed protein product [Mytilus coruscus]|uniref:Uncharacterized protein n=1 Tax=Mytilus coruscus TaxID=42192 RepID=A0A6J8C5N3_MYTCO|nr:unnamed protein product [Mytilus coruscus]
MLQLWRRSFIKGDIQPIYKALCDDTTLVTDTFFGDDIKEKIKELDAIYSVCKKLGKDHHKSRNSHPSANRGHSHKGHGLSHRLDKRSCRKYGVNQTNLKNSMMMRVFRLQQDLKQEGKQRPKVDHSESDVSTSDDLLDITAEKLQNFTHFFSNNFISGKNLCFVIS